MNHPSATKQNPRINLKYNRCDLQNTWLLTCGKPLAPSRLQRRPQHPATRYILYARWYINPRLLKGDKKKILSVELIHTQTGAQCCFSLVENCRTISTIKFPCIRFVHDCTGTLATSKEKYVSSSRLGYSSISYKN